MHCITICKEVPETPRAAKCHGYDGYIRVKISVGWEEVKTRQHTTAKLRFKGLKFKNRNKIE